MTGQRSRVWLVLLCGAALAACAPKKLVKKTAGEQPLPPEAAAADVSETGPFATPGVDVSEADIHDGAQFVESVDLKPIHFDYDAYGIQDEARAILQKNAEHLKAHPDLEALVAGHCDERGTTPYNLALGQKRAKEVREYYIRLGVAGKSLATISYGEEQPACKEASEECWRRNRRAETRIRARTAHNGGGGIDPKAPR